MNAVRLVFGGDTHEEGVERFPPDLDLTEALRLATAGMEPLRLKYIHAKVGSRERRNAETILYNAEDLRRKVEKARDAFLEGK